MKIFFGLVLSLCGFAAQADATIQLIQPALADIGQRGRTACVGTGFAADHSVVGQCHTVTGSACSGRGCQPVTTTTNYVATWDATGLPTGVSACSTVRHHLPQVDQVTYLNGHSAADCMGVVFDPTKTVIGISYGPYAWQVEYFYYVTTDAVTGAILANSSTAGYLFLPSVDADAPGKFY